MSSWKRALRQSLQIPFALAAGAGLATVLTLIFAVEVFMSEVYKGPFKQFLVSFRHTYLTKGVYSDCAFFNINSYLLGHLFSNLEGSDEL